MGADVLDKFGLTITINSDEHIIKWVDHSIPLKDPHKFFGPNMLTNLNDQLCQDKEEEMFKCDLLDNYSARILRAKYEQVNINKVAADQKHLTPNQLYDLQSVLAKYKKLFDGSLGVHPHKRVHIDLLLGLEPVHHRAYPVPCTHEQTFKKELQRMIDFGILKECGASEWALPCFIIHKKDSHVRQISDL